MTDTASAALGHARGGAMAPVAAASLRASSPTLLNIPGVRPARPEFSTGPTAKAPAWSSDQVMERFIPGRSHRSGPCKAQLKQVIDASADLLGLPKGWICAIVPASDTGAVELALWNFLSDARGADVLAFDAFSSGWAKDMKGPLGLTNMRVFEAEYGELPDLGALDFDRDVVLTWNGTTAGTCLPNGDFIPADRKGLVICDATSAAFAMDLPYDKLDVLTWSWQKSLGGEAGHGMIALSPAAQARLAEETPERGLPKIFTVTKGGAVNAGLFKGATINTPSMLAVADHLVGLDWAESLGGLSGLIARVDANAEAVEAHVAKSGSWTFLAKDPAIRSKTALCLECIDPAFQALDADTQKQVLKALETRLADEGIAYDIGSYRDAPSGLRLWGGPTVDAADLAALMPWIDWALTEELTKLQEANHA